MVSNSDENSFVDFVCVCLRIPQLLCVVQICVYQNESMQIHGKLPSIDTKNIHSYQCVCVSVCWMLDDHKYKQTLVRLGSLFDWSIRFLYIQQNKFSIFFFGSVRTTHTENIRFKQLLRFFSSRFGFCSDDSLSKTQNQQRLCIIICVATVRCSHISWL